MRIVICDRCRKEIRDGKNIGRISATLWTDRGIQIAPNPYEKWELCEACMEEIGKAVVGTAIMPDWREPENVL